MASHWIWAGLGALAVWPIKHVWENWIEKFWTAFWLGFKANFKKTPAGKQFFDAYHQSRAKKDAEIAKEHPELEEMLHCKKCNGTGTKGTMLTPYGMGDLVCDDCGGTGWV